MYVYMYTVYIYTVYIYIYTLYIYIYCNEKAKWIEDCPSTWTTKPNGVLTYRRGVPSSNLTWKVMGHHGNQRAIDPLFEANVNLHFPGDINIYTHRYTTIYIYTHVM